MKWEFGDTDENKKARVSVPEPDGLKGGFFQSGSFIEFIGDI